MLSTGVKVWKMESGSMKRDEESPYCQDEEILPQEIFVTCETLHCTLSFDRANDIHKKLIKISISSIIISIILHQFIALFVPSIAPPVALSIAPSIYCY